MPSVYAFGLKLIHLSTGSPLPIIFSVLFFYFFSMNKEFLHECKTFYKGYISAVAMRISCE